VKIPSLEDYERKTPTDNFVAIASRVVGDDADNWPRTVHSFILPLETSATYGISRARTRF
jgi:hypothetical protein